MTFLYGSGLITNGCMSLTVNQLIILTTIPLLRLTRVLEPTYSLVEVHYQILKKATNKTTDTAGSGHIEANKNNDSD